MSTTIVNSFKYLGLITLVLFSVIACEKDFENVGVGLVDNDLFSTADTTFEVIAYNKNIDSSRIDGIPRYLLGVYNDDNFGLLKSSFIGQLNLAAIKFSDNMSIDAVVLDIPYYASKLEDNTDGTPNFELDSIIGDQGAEFNLSVYELGTFLNTLDPSDPTKNKKYYSNEIDYVKKALLYTGDFKPNKNDTLLYVDRNFIEGNPRDTIKKENALPSIKIPLDTVFFRNSFINQQNSGVFESNDSFKEYFRGLIIEVDGTDGAMMQLAMSNASVTIYYTNEVLTDETTTTGDLNGDGDTDDKDVPVRTKQITSFGFGGVRTSQYNRDYTSSNVDILDKFDHPDVTNGDDKLFVQGAAGSIAVVELFKDVVNLNELREKNWLINEANLTLYVENPNDTIIPNKLYLYKYDYNSQILDALTEGFIDGNLQKGEDNKPLKYEFSITDYISEVLKNDSDSLSLNKLAIKTYQVTDPPIIDTLASNFSWDAKGVVLKGNNLPKIENDELDPTRLKLEIFYTENNQ